MTVAILDYGNAGAVRRALQAEGVESFRTSDPAALLSASAVVLPGVGHARDTMAWLAAHGMDGTLRALAAHGRRIVGICVGGQVLCQRSEEGDTDCLGLVPGQVRRREMFVGWREVEGVGLRYFCHSYAMPADRVQHGAITAFQYHPEKSGAAGVRELAAACGYSQGMSPGMYSYPRA